MTKSCPSCAAPVREGKAFCSNCGAQLDALPEGRAEPVAPEFARTVLTPPAAPQPLRPPRGGGRPVKTRPPASEPAPARGGFRWKRVALFGAAALVLLFLLLVVSSID